MRPAIKLALAVFALAWASPFAACGGPHASADGKPSPSSPPAPLGHTAAELDKATPAARVILTYLDVHKSLTTDATDAAKQRFAALATAASAKGAIANDALRTGVVEGAKAGAMAKDLAAARKAFDAVSRALLEWLRAEPSPISDTLRVANCPMAFDTGAKWLQLSDKIENPYFGTEMPTCGSIDQKLEPGAKLPAR